MPQAVSHELRVEPYSHGYDRIQIVRNIGMIPFVILIATAAPFDSSTNTLDLLVRWRSTTKRFRSIRSRRIETGTSIEIIDSKPPKKKTTKLEYYQEIV